MPTTLRIGYFDLTGLCVGHRGLWLRPIAAGVHRIPSAPVLASSERKRQLPEPWRVGASFAAPSFVGRSANSRRIHCCRSPSNRGSSTTSHRSTSQATFLTTYFRPRDDTGRTLHLRATDKLPPLLLPAELLFS